MARLDFELELNHGGTLISVYQAYQEYLKENQLMDPVEAVRIAAAKKGSQDLLRQKNLAEGDGSDIEGLEEPSYNENGANRFKFENVIKSMVARLELQNGLAPVQEYGRHFAQANKKKKAQKQAESANIDEQSDLGNNFHDQFYDLDDGFIDDEGMDCDQQEDGYTQFFQDSTVRD